MKICVFAPVPPPLVGSSYAVQLLLESRFARAFDILHIDTSYASSVSDMGRPRPEKFLRLVKYLGRMIGAVRSGYDTVLLTPAFSRNPFLRDAIAMIVAKLSGARLVLWSNSNDLTQLYENSGKPLRSLMRMVLSRADHVVTVGGSLKRHFRPFLSDERLSVIPNGIPDRSRSVERPVREAVRVIYLSNMIRSKGWELLLTVAEETCAAEPGVSFDFFGAPSADSSLADIESRFAASGNARIQYHGPVDGEPKLAALAAADIFCLPTMYPTEALPLSILEAFRDGLAVVSTPIGAIADAVVDGEGGFLTGPGDRQALAARLLELIRQPDLRRRMGAFNRNRYETMYTMDAVAARWITLFEQMEEQMTPRGAQ